jgi:hypothetical protein
VRGSCSPIVVILLAALSTARARGQAASAIADPVDGEVPLFEETVLFPPAPHSWSASPGGWADWLSLARFNLAWVESK